MYCTYHQEQNKQHVKDMNTNTGTCMNKIYMQIADAEIEITLNKHILHDRSSFRFPKNYPIHLPKQTYILGRKSHLN